MRYAVPLPAVIRVTRAAALTSLPDGAPNLLGLINLHGLMVPVINMRRVLGLPERELDLEDVFVFLRSDRRTVALVADGVEPVVTLPEERITAASAVLPELPRLQCIARLDGDIILIHDLESCISTDLADDLAAVPEAPSA